MVTISPAYKSKSLFVDHDKYTVFLIIFNISTCVSEEVLGNQVPSTNDQCSHHCSIDAAISYLF
jgi:hypothetical protein